MIRMTVWSPDTCGCVFGYEWNDAEPEESRTHTLKSVLKRCAEHKGATDAYSQVLDENIRKNKVLGLAQRLAPGLTPHDYEWEFDSERKLKVKFGKLTAKQKKELKALCDSDLGIERVEVE